MADEIELLRDYSENGSEEAFRVLVELHARMVHSVALRVLRNESIAEEVTQAVFIILARKASSLGRKTVLAGWLYRTARFVAREAVRREQRRLEREERMMHIHDSAGSASVWEQIAPELDEALSRLGKSDREALVLRFLEQRSFGEVATALRITEAAAKMRVGRALEKLQNVLGRAGVVVPAAALAAALSTHAASAAPAGLTAGVVTSALVPSGAAKSSILGLAKGTLILMTWNKVKAGATAAALLVLLGGGGVAGWKWYAESHGRGVVMQTFEPMAGEWDGTVTLKRDGSVLADRQPCSMSVTTEQGGRVCQIELRLRLAPGEEPFVQHYSHSLNERGDRLFTISDPASGRGNGECLVTASSYRPETGEWHAAMRFPLPGKRGVMEGSWERRGDALIVRSHDQFYDARGTIHAYADLQFRRRISASAQ